MCISVVFFFYVAGKCGAFFPYTYIHVTVIYNKHNLRHFFNATNLRIYKDTARHNFKKVADSPNIRNDTNFPNFLTKVLISCNY